MAIEVIAHRGANREAPENTLAAFERALKIGVQGIELDVHVSRDGVPAVHHDPFLHDGSNFQVALLNARELQRRNVPTLEDVISLVDAHCQLYVEIKASAALDPVADMLKHRTTWCSVHSFDHRISLRTRTLAPELATGILLAGYLVDIEHAIQLARARDVWQQIDFIDRELVDRVHHAGARVIAWTVNDTMRAGFLAELGVDGICTDNPRDLLVAIRSGSS